MDKEARREILTNHAWKSPGLGRVESSSQKFSFSINIVVLCFFFFAVLHLTNFATMPVTDTIAVILVAALGALLTEGACARVVKRPPADMTLQASPTCWCTARKPSRPWPQPSNELAASVCCVLPLPSCTHCLLPDLQWTSPKRFGHQSTRLEPLSKINASHFISQSLEADQKKQKKIGWSCLEFFFFLFLFVLDRKGESNYFSPLCFPAGLAEKHGESLKRSLMETKLKSNAAVGVIFLILLTTFRPV